ncbi:MAG TPA: PqqD family protein [Nitrospira sp.]|nr:PqqD family protein [Nitrospira sp.]
MPATVHLSRESQLELSELFPRQDEQVHSTVLDGESVLLNLNSGRYYTLNVVGSAIWDLCRGEQSLRQINSAVCARFDVSEQQAQDDMLELIVLLEQEGLLHTEGR